jgi:VWFA-related protein
MPKTKCLHRAVLLTALIGPLAAAAARVPTAPQKIQQELKHDVSVTLKLLQVYVSDEQGRPVPDLRREDFMLYDNGEPRDITDFERHLMPARKPEAGGETRAVAGPGPTPPRLPRKFFMLLDLVGNDDVGVIKAKRTALHFLESQLLPADQAAVLSFTPGTGLNLHCYLTDDAARLKKAIKEAKEVPPGKTPPGPSWGKLMQQAEAEAGLAPENAATQTMSGETAFREPSLALKLRSAAYLPLEVSELSKALNYLPGHKHLVFFSGGGYRRLLPLYRRMGRELAASNCLVYAVNTMGERSNLRGYEYVAGENLEVLASLSGGRYYEDVDRAQEIASDIQNASGNYYVLGYAIDSAWDGAYHELKVEVRREGCRVHAQAGYFNPKPFSQFSDLEKQLHLLDLALSPHPYHQEPLRIPLLPLICRKSGGGHLILMSCIPVAQIKQHLQGKSELITLLYDQSGALVASNRGEVMFEAIPEEKLFQYTVTELPPGSYEGRLVVRDLDTGGASVGSASVRIPDPKEKIPLLDPPLLLVPGERARFLRLSQATDQGESMPSIAEFYPFVSNHWLPLIDRLAAAPTPLLAVLRVRRGSVVDPENMLSVRWLDQTRNRRVMLSFSALESRSLKDADVWLIRLDLPALESGRYTLEISSRAGAGGPPVSVARSLEVF